MRVQPLHGHKYRKHAMAFAEGCGGFSEGRDVATVFGVYFGPRLMKVNCTVLGLFVSAGSHARDVFCDRGWHRPDERMNRTEHEDKGLFVPTRFTESFAGIFRRMRLKCPGRVGA